MTGSTMVALELSLTFLVVVGWGLWELYKLKKDR
jgi:hypothetical protein